MSILGSMSQQEERSDLWLSLTEVLKRNVMGMSEFVADETHEGVVGY